MSGKLMRVFGRRRAAHDEQAWLAPFAALVVLIFFGQMASAPGQSLLSVYSEAELGRPPHFTSTLVSTQLIFGAVAAFLGGTLADTFGQKRVMVLGATGLPLVGVIFMMRSWVALILLLMYVGFVLTLYMLGRQAYTMALVPPRRLGLATAIAFTGVTMGSAVGNFVAGPLIARHGFGTMGAVVVVVGLCVLVAVHLVIPDARRPAPQATPQRFGGYGGIVRRRTTLLLLMVQSLPTVYYGAASLLIPLLIYRVGQRPELAAYYATASLLFASVSQLLTGRLLDRYGPRWVVIMLTVLVAATCFVTSRFTGSLAGLFVCGIIGIGLAWALSVVYPVLVNELCPREEHGRTLGLIHMAWCAGMLVGTQAGGRLVEIDSGLPFLAIGGLNLLAIAGAVTLAPRLRRARELALETMER